jgi:hypothetical protein
MQNIQTELREQIINFSNDNFPSTFVYVTSANGLHDDLLTKHVLQSENS